MSRSWSSATVRVHLGAGTLAACVVHGRGRRCRVAAKQLFLIEADRRGGAFEALAQWLGLVAPGIPVGWVLGHRDVRYLVLPWSPELADSRLCDTVARTLLSKRFGLDPSLFEVRMGPARHGRARLAAFVALDLLTEIKAHAQRARRRLASIEPGVAVVWERFASQFSSEHGVVRLIEADRQIVVSHDGAQIESIALAPCGVQGDQRVAPAGPGEAIRFFSSNPSTDEAPDAGRRLMLPGAPGFDTLADASYAFALCGVL